MEALGIIAILTAMSSNIVLTYFVIKKLQEKEKDTNFIHSARKYIPKEERDVYTREDVLGDVPLENFKPDTTKKVSVQFQDEINPIEDATT